MLRFLSLAYLFFAVSFLPADAASPRHVISLDGEWQIAEGTWDTIPVTFARTVPVPGLVDLAEPAFEHVRQGQHKDPHRDAYWYRREFTVDTLADVARLKIHKAMFGVKVILNGTEIGEYPGCSTPAYFDVTKVLKQGKNELFIRVGADLASVEGKTIMPRDQEKIYYIPGIFDSVELILSGTPVIENIQTVPDIVNARVGVQAQLINTGSAVEKTLKLTVKEWKSGATVGSTERTVSLPAHGVATLETSVQMTNCQLWSPESPFLYILEAETDSDFVTTRFGMRTFRFNPETKLAELNGKPYFMRGSNITPYRFFEDESRGQLPWDKDWVRQLHEKVKDMHWNCLRYCIGFPPEFWYDLCDELGILIQDEFPIWEMNIDNVNKYISTENLVNEYIAWMRERWNHPCVVIWDACNETRSPQTIEAIAKVRNLDLSNRPWDNGWNPPSEPGDSFEAHPYHFQNPNFKLSGLATLPRFIPRGGVQKDTEPNAVVNNEYGWLWLNRDGTPTLLTEKLYENLLGLNATSEQRYYTYATYLAAETEFFRAYRKCAAVMHFTVLTYSRTDGFTSDHWMNNLADLEWEPNVYKYVRDAFAPVGLMIEYWNDRIFLGDDQSAKIPVVLINDLEAPWKGNVALRLTRGGETVWTTSQPSELASFGTANVTFDIEWAKTVGNYRLEAELTGVDGKPVVCVRDLQVLDPQTATYPILDAIASSVNDRKRQPAQNAIDGDEETYWGAAREAGGGQPWIIFDLGQPREIKRLEILWHNTYATKHTVRVSNDLQNWTDVYGQEDGKGGREAITLDKPVTNRYVRINTRARNVNNVQVQIAEFKVFER